MGWLHSVARKIFGEYAFYVIYGAQPDKVAEVDRNACALGPIPNVGEIERSEDPALRALAQYSGDEALAFGAWLDGRLTAVCSFWFGARYATRNFWPLRPHEAKLVQIVTSEAFRGRGIASKLIAYASREMGKLGFRRLYARIWHSNRASVSAFRKAGWEYTGLVVEIFPFGAKKPWRFVRRAAPRIIEIRSE
jgi:RimJ/RimL family protein N-acetyltransferase